MIRTKSSAVVMELDLGRYELCRAGRRVKLEKKPMELLIFLVGRRGQLVSRKDIVTKLWRSGLFIDTEPNINNIVRKIRAALGDSSSKPRFLETVVGKGYRFIGPLRVIGARFPSEEFQTNAAGEANREPVSTRTERTSLAVLPLVHLGAGSDDQGMCLGFAEALTARLGNLQGVDVLPTSMVLNIPDNLELSGVGTRLGVRFVVHGAVRKLKGQWQLSLGMFDTTLRAASLTRKCELDLNRLSDLEDEIAKRIARALNRTLQPPVQRHPRYSQDPLAYSDFMRGYRLSSSSDPALLEQAAQRLNNAVARDPGFFLAHAILSLVCAERHFEFDPASIWLEKAEFHCQRALEGDPDLPEGHLAKAFLLWGPSKNFQHLEAITELRKAITLQKNLPNAYNRLGTILAHIGLLDHAREMYERGRQFHPQKAISHGIVQVYMWNQEYDLAREQIQAWRIDKPASKYPVYFAPLPSMMEGNWKDAKPLLEEAVELLPEDPMVLSMQGVFYAMTGKAEQALQYMAKACAIPKSFGHAHHTYYQIACILALLKQPTAAFEWLERSVSTGFACWPFFVKDPCLQSLHGLTVFEDLVSSLQAKYPDHLGLL